MANRRRACARRPTPKVVVAKALADAAAYRQQLKAIIKNRRKQQRPRRRRAPRARRGLKQGSPGGLAIPAVYRPRNGSSLTFTRTARLGAMTIDSAKTPKPGTVLFDLPINPSMHDDLAAFAGRYDFIHYRSIVFTVVSSLPSSASGSYVAAFLPDADQSLRCGLGLLDQLTATGGTVFTKSYMGSTFRAPVPQRQFYTVVKEGAEMRTYSPGRFVLAVDGPINQWGSLSVNMTYTVTLSGPTINREADGHREPGIVNGSLYTLIGKYDNLNINQHAYYLMTTKGDTHAFTLPPWVLNAVPSAGDLVWFYHPHPQVRQVTTYPGGKARNIAVLIDRVVYSRTSGHLYIGSSDAPTEVSVLFGYVIETTDTEAEADYQAVGLVPGDSLHPVITDSETECATGFAIRESSPVSKMTSSPPSSEPSEILATALSSVSPTLARELRMCNGNSLSVSELVNIVTKGLAKLTVSRSSSHSRDSSSRPLTTVHQCHVEQGYRIEYDDDSRDLLERALPTLDPDNVLKPLNVCVVCDKLRPSDNCAALTAIEGTHHDEPCIFVACECDAVYGVITATDLDSARDQVGDASCTCWFPDTE